ncbi:hypothetical protein JL09_g6031 [Pichia kudriavzevii]|uniref:Uncharacterized protein n=1 Tax=Pichia kudriavzevii TaxID=4909 RepID=A0A099NQL4_PICKU|nr:hypothetical protein JL09_g6031 [Pichia kudriavzevii]
MFSRNICKTIKVSTQQVRAKSTALNPQLERITFEAVQ